MGTFWELADIITDFLFYLEIARDPLISSAASTACLIIFILTCVVTFVRELLDIFVASYPYTYGGFTSRIRVWIHTFGSDEDYEEAQKSSKRSAGLVAVFLLQIEDVPQLLINTFVKVARGQLTPISALSMISSVVSIQQKIEKWHKRRVIIREEQSRDKPSRIMSYFWLVSSIGIELMVGFGAGCLEGYDICGPVERETAGIVMIATACGLCCCGTCIFACFFYVQDRLSLAHGGS